MTILRFHRYLLLLAFALALPGPQAHAAEPGIQSINLTERGHDLFLSADVSLNLSNQLEDAAERGLPLYFTAEVEIRRPRWYWFDETVLSSSQTWRIIHNPLTRQWRVSAGVLALPVGSLSEALSVVRHVRTWRIADRDALKGATEYEGRMRVRFDVSQLSKVNALNSNDWSQSTPWTDFAVTVKMDYGNGNGNSTAPATPVAPVQPTVTPPAQAPPTPPAVAPPMSVPPGQPTAPQQGGTGLSLPGEGNPGGIGLTPGTPETP